MANIEDKPPKKIPKWAIETDLRILSRSELMKRIRWLERDRAQFERFMDRKLYLIHKHLTDIMP